MRAELAPQVFEPPADWLTVSLGELEPRAGLSLKNGFSCGTHELGGSGVPHLRPFNVTEDARVSLKDIKTIPYRAGLEEYALQPGDILFNNTNSEDLVGKCAYWSGGVGLHVLSNHMTIMRVRDSDQVDPRFLAFHLYRFWVTGSARMICRRHVNQASIGLQRMRQIIVRFPPLREQQAIAAVLTKIQGAVEVQERLVAALKELKAATMAKLFREGLRGEPLKQTEIGEIPRSWTLMEIGDLGDLVTGTTPPTSNREYYNGATPFISPADIGDCRVVRESQKTLSDMGAAVARQLPPRSVLVVCIGATIGKVGMTDAKVSCTNQQINAVICSDAFVPEFVHYLLFWNRDRVRRLSTPSPVPLLSKSAFGKGLVAVPRNRAEQEEIASTLCAVDDRLEVALRELRTHQRVFQSMLHSLMTGQLRVPMEAQVGVKATGPVGYPGRPRPWESDKVLERVERFVAELVRRFEPERVILFGQPAEGSPRAFGEVGLLVEMEFEGLARDQGARMAHEIPHDFSLDLVVRRPEDVARAVEMGDAFIKGVLERGRTLHVRPSGVPARREKAPRRETPPRRGRVSEETLREIVQRIVETVQPERIILFGSAARGEMGPDSDVDLLVVKDCGDRRETARTISWHLIGVAPGLPKDVIVVTPEEVERDRDTIGLIIRPALREGRVVYAA